MNIAKMIQNRELSEIGGIPLSEQMRRRAEADSQNMEYYDKGYVPVAEYQAPNNPVSNKVKNSSDHIYFNVQITNQGDSKILAKYDQSLSQPFLGTKASNYNISVIRFKIPTQDIPIFNFIPQPGPNPTYATWSNVITYSTSNNVTYLGSNYSSLVNNNLNHTPNTSPTFWQLLPVLNNDPNKGIYSVTLTYGAVVVQVYLEYVPNRPLSLFPVPQSWLTVDPNNYTYYRIFFYQQFIDMINVALASAFSNVLFNGSPPKVASAPNPYLIFNPVTELISLIVDQSFDPAYVGAPTINIYFNNPLFSFFQNFQIFRFAFNDPFGRDAQILVKDNGNNVMGAVYTMTQEYADLYQWSILDKIVIQMTGTPNVRSEYAPYSSQVGSGIQGIPAQISVLTDFEIIIEKPQDNRSYVTFFPQGPYRFLDLIGEVDFSSLSLNYFWQDVNANLYPLYILSGEVLTTKILFQRRDIYTNNEALI